MNIPQRSFFSSVDGIVRDPTASNFTPSQGEREVSPGALSLHSDKDLNGNGLQIASRSRPSSFDQCDRVIVHSCSMCPYAQRVRAMLVEKNIAFRVTELDNDVLLKRKDKPEW